jgi:hypothetical protein
MTGVQELKSDTPKLDSPDNWSAFLDVTYLDYMNNTFFKLST